MDPNSYDLALNDIKNNASKLVICSQLPATFTEANVTYKLATKMSPVIAAPSNKAGGGREIIISPITDGVVDASGEGTHWVILDTVNSRIKVAQELTDSQTLTAGNPFTLTTLSVGLPTAV